MSGQLQPGQRLTSRKPAKELGASDMPVRSAAIRLQAPGALSPMPKGNVEVPLISAESGLAFTGHADMLRSQIVQNGPEMPPDIPAGDLKK